MELKLDILLLGLVLLASCGPAQDTQLERKLVAASSRDSIVDLTELVREKWDHVCVIAPYTPPEQAKELTGVDWRGFKRSGIQYSDDINLLVFLKDRRIVRSALVKRRVDFDFNPRSVCVARDSARFRPLALPAEGPGHFRLELAHG